MVLMRRKDKRKGNAEEELAVASDPSIVSNKGVRSLGGARTGRFAADMRVQVGGYGRADKTWGVDHPWHSTRENLMNDLTSRDKLEEGFLAKETEKKVGHGLSRAALKKKKNKSKKTGDDVVAGSGEASSTTTEAAPQSDNKDAPLPSKKSNAKKQSKDAAALQKEDEKTDVASASAAEPASEAASKKRKRVNRNKKKKERKTHSGDISDDFSDDDDSDVDMGKEDKKKPAAKSNKKQKVVATKPEDTTKKEAAESPQLTKAQKEEDVKKREAIATQYASALGQEFTTASGLGIRDARIGTGRVPSIGEMLTVRYRGRIGDKTGIVFGKGMLTTTFGTGSVIAGWEEGMGTMRTGGIRYLDVPPELGYGESAKGNGKIPPNSTLFFEVELIRIGKRKREVIAKDDTPLPSSFQRKRAPTSGKNSHTNAQEKKGKSKRSRRKFSI